MTMTRGLALLDLSLEGLRLDEAVDSLLTPSLGFRVTCSGGWHFRGSGDSEGCTSSARGHLVIESVTTE